MKVYKIKHIPTGLYFKPSRGGSNLSKTGKIYPQKPSLSWIGDIRIDIWYKGNAIKDDNIISILNNHFNLGLDMGKKEWIHIQRYFPSIEKDWEIIEID